MSAKPYRVVGIGDDGGETLLEDFDKPGEAARWLERYTAREDAGGWDRIKITRTYVDPFGLGIRTVNLWLWEKGEAW